MKKIRILIVLLYACCQLAFANDCDKYISQFYNDVYKKSPYTQAALDWGQINYKNAEEVFQLARKNFLNHVNKVAESETLPTFKNTVEKLDYLANELDRAFTTISHLNATMGNKIWEELEKNANLDFIDAYNQYYSNLKLARKLKIISKQKLTLEQEFLVDTYLEGFSELGFGKDKSSARKLVRISEELSDLEIDFAINQKYELASRYITFQTDELEGLPESLINNLKAKAADYKIEGFAMNAAGEEHARILKYAHNRNTRYRVHEHLMGLGRSGYHSNQEVIRSILRLRHRQANILGHKNYSELFFDYLTMTEKLPKAIEIVTETKKLMEEVSSRDLEKLQKFAEARDGLDKLEPWDIGYYTELYRKEVIGLSSEEVASYFEFKTTVKKMFELYGKVYNLEFTPLDVPVYHPDVLVFLCRDKKLDKDLGLYYLDPFSRMGKERGAWSISLRAGQNHRFSKDKPHVVNVLNIPKNPVGKTLLDIEDVEVQLHESGHAVNDFLSQLHSGTLAGTQSVIDVVEIPSMMMEYFMRDPRGIKMLSAHHETGEPMSDDMIEKVLESRRFMGLYGSAWSTGSLQRIANRAYLDLMVHQENPKNIQSLKRYEDRVFGRKQGSHEEILISNFGHLFTGGGYASGYFTYLSGLHYGAHLYEWLFPKNEPLNLERWEIFRKEFLAKGGLFSTQEDYIKFRGEALPDYKNFLRVMGYIP
ncbi:MAG: hypothetical protein JNM93_14200 [Bacteriovoracaceae bacterium]|nr:hypothetical protein [Bacteriovoracaceae bacterium]